MKIGIVEDDSVMAWLLEEACQSSGHQIVGIAPAAHAAIPLIERMRPDCLLIDYKLDGERNGLDVLEQAKRIRPSLFTVMITGWDVNDIAGQMGPVRPDCILRKPLHVETLLAILAKAERGIADDRTSRRDTACRLQYQPKYA